MVAGRTDMSCPTHWWTTRARLARHVLGALAVGVPLGCGPSQEASAPAAELQALRAEVAELRAMVDHLYSELGVSRKSD